LNLEIHMKRRYPLAMLIAALPLLARAQDGGIWGNKTEVTVGAGLASEARYPGSGSERVLPVPVLAIQRGILFADTTRGIGLQYQSASGFYAAQSVFYDLGRLDHDSSWRPGSNRLSGMGDLPGSVTARTLVAQQVTPWLLASAEAELALRDGARRNRYRTCVEFSAVKTEADSVTVDVDAWWGDGRYNRAYFGVTPAQAARTGFAVYRPGAGLYARSASLTWEHRFGSRWATTVQVTDTRYAGKADASPVVAQHASAGANAAITYTY